MPSIASLRAVQRFAWTTFWNFGAFSTGSKRLTREFLMCNVNNAVTDKVILPHKDAQPIRISWRMCGNRPLLSGIIDGLCMRHVVIFYLTKNDVRHNITYIIHVEGSNGQTKESRSENAGVETDGHSQPSPR